MYSDFNKPDLPIIEENNFEFLNKISENYSVDKSILIVPIFTSFNVAMGSTDTHEKERDPKKKFLGKKRNYFRIDSLNDSKIFKEGYYDDYSMEMINQANALLENSLNNKKPKKRPQIKEISIREESEESKRKFKTDLIKVKFFNKFFKRLIKELNYKLKLANSEKTFRNIPSLYIKQFLHDIAKSKKTISEQDLSLEKILSKEFCKSENKKNKKGEEKKSLTTKNFEHNQSVLKYLEENNKIDEVSKFNIFKKMKFSNIFENYLNSIEFGKDISYIKFNINKKKLTEEKDEYILNYIIKARNFLALFY